MMLPPFWIKYSIWNFDQNAIRLCHQGRINKFELILSIISIISQANEIQWFFNPVSEVISLRRSGLSKDTKRLPGKNLAVFIGVVISSLILSYNLTRDLSFILTSDKERIIDFYFLCIKSGVIPLKDLYCIWK